MKVYLVNLAALPAMHPDYKPPMSPAAARLRCAIARREKPQIPDEGKRIRAAVARREAERFAAPQTPKARPGTP